MLNIQNPFVPIYHSVNNGTNEEKYSRIYNARGGGNSYIS